MRNVLIAICTIITLLTLPGCAQLFGRFERPETCKSSGVAPSVALKDAPVWVPGSPMREGKPENGICGDGSVHVDNLCVVADVADVSSIAQGEGTVRQKSLRLLGEELGVRMGRVLGSSATPERVTAFSKELRDAIGGVTDTWISPNCTAYAIAEVELTDFELVVRGPTLSSEARALLLEDANKIIGLP